MNFSAAFLLEKQPGEKDKGDRAQKRLMTAKYKIAKGFRSQHVTWERIPEQFAPNMRGTILKII